MILAEGEALAPFMSMQDTGANAFNGLGVEAWPTFLDRQDRTLNPLPWSKCTPGSGRQKKTKNGSG